MTHPVIEVMARAFYERDRATIAKDAPPWRDATAKVRAWCIEHVVNMIKAAEISGFVLVPMEPTPKQMHAAERHHALPTASCDHRASIYAAMLDARPKLTEAA